MPQNFQKESYPRCQLSTSNGLQAIAQLECIRPDPGLTGTIPLAGAIPSWAPPGHHPLADGHQTPRLRVDLDGHAVVKTDAGLLGAAQSQ